MILFIPTSGCLGWGQDIDVPSDIQEEPTRIVFDSPTLDRSEDLGAVIKLDERLSASPVLLFWVSPHCGGCHNWTQNIIDEGHYNRWNDSNELQLLTIHRYIEFEDSESMMEVYGNNSSSEYTPWPILVPDADSRAIDLVKPIIVRLEGTNVNEGKDILEKSGIRIITAKDLEDAATKVVNLVEG